MAKVIKRGPASPQMNMTPLIDVTFQLIIFFMLVSNIVSQETVPMVVPKLERSQAREMKKQDRVVVNVAPQPFDTGKRPPGPKSEKHLLHSGKPSKVKVGMEEYQPSELGKITESLKESVSQNKDVRVLLRADAALHYKEVQPIMRAIASAGVKRVNVVAYKKRKNK